jgi:coiled-coil domain-containing protein 61
MSRSGVSEEELEFVISNDTAKYRLTITPGPHETFSLLIISEDYTRRWEGSYSANFIDEITQKAGCTKKMSVFWRLLLDAAGGECQNAQLDILTPSEVKSLSRSHLGIVAEDKIYVLLTQLSDYDCFKYPIPVKIAPFTMEEYEKTIRTLYHDNKDLHEALAAAECTPTLLQLESRIAELGALSATVRDQQEKKIASLKKKVKFLKGKLSENRWHNPPPQLEKRAADAPE